MLWEMPRPSLEPYWQTSDSETVRLYHGDVLDVLQCMPSQAVQMVVTSPPYWGLRDYGTGEREIGRERTPQEYVDKMVLVFRELRRVLRDDGTLWLNTGDGYSAGPGGNNNPEHHKKTRERMIVEGKTATSKLPNSWRQDLVRTQKPGISLKSGNLVGAPWRLALALQADGWVLRQDIIWHKPSPMPESVRNRCTKAHEYLFLLAKSNRYYYDAEAIKEKAKHDWNSYGSFASPGSKSESMALANRDLYRTRGLGTHHPDVVQSTSNKRSVWTIAGSKYDGAHFAVFPTRLVEPCILAGTSAKGCCTECSTPWKRIVEAKPLIRKRLNDYVKRTGLDGTGNSCANSVAGVDVRTIGWEPTCKCSAGIVPCIVLDPFIGSGTTAVVCIDKGRRCWGIDLSEKYLRENSVPRIEGELLSRPSLAHLAGKRTEKVLIGRKIN